MQTTDQGMENRLKALVEGNKPENRAKWAKDWKKQGKKVVGLLCNYVPEEIISAFGVMPWRVTGTWREATPMASLYRPEMTCRYCSHVLESVMNGDLDFLDGIITTNLDDDFKRLWDVLNFIHKPAFSYLMYLPHTSSNTTFQMWLKTVFKFKQAMEDFSGVKIEESELRHQIEVYNTMRTLLKQVYELRRREIPAISGTEALGITTSARIMPRDHFNKEIEVILPYLENRKVTAKKASLRILMSGEYLDNPAYVKLVEDTGSLVVMDDFDTGSKYFWEPVNGFLKDPWEALATRYLNRPTGTARMANWNEQADQIISWVGEFNCDGVVELRQLYSLPLDYRFFILKRKLAEADIPYISLSREYHLSHVGMLQTRIEAFMEMIHGKSAKS